MHAESSWYFIKNNFHTKIAWRLNISLVKSPNSHDISDEAKVGQPPKTVPKMKRAGAPLWVHKQPHLLMSVSSLQTVASKRVAPSSHPQLDWPALGCSMCSLARIMLALTWGWGAQAGQKCLVSYSPLWLSNTRLALLRPPNVPSMLLPAGMVPINWGCRIRMLLLGKLFFLLFEL